MQGVARARHAAAADRFREADAGARPCSARCRVDGIADSLPYRVLAGLELGRSRPGDRRAPSAAVVPELRPVAAAAEAVAVAADAALLLAYGEGTWASWPGAAGLAAAGALGGVARAGRHRRGAAHGGRCRRHGPAHDPAAAGPGGGALGPGPPRRPAWRPSACRRSGARRARSSAARRRGRRRRAGGAGRAGAAARLASPLEPAGRARAPRVRARRPRRPGVPRRLAARDRQRAGGAADVRGRRHARGDEQHGRGRRGPGGGTRSPNRRGPAAEPRIRRSRLPTYPWRHACPARRRGRPCPAEVPRAPARRRAARRHPRGHARPPGRRRGGRDRLGQDDPAAEDVPRAGARRAGQIGHTQPRRIAARSVAERIAEEMEVELGDLVGYQVRFTDHSSDATRVKVMTDGILLAEMQRDRDLRRYDTIIIDEAHERSLNIDFILGYLKQLLPRRPDLKVVITSATIDPAPVRAALRDRRAGRGRARGAGHRGVGAHLPGRGPLPAARRAAPRRPARRRRARPGDRRRRGRRGAVDRGAAEPRGDRHPRVLLRRARDPRRRGGPQRPEAARHRGAAALRPALRRRAAPRLPPGERTADHPRDQRRRDLAHRARASATSSTPAPPGSPATASAPRCSGCRSSRSAGPARPSAPAAAGGWRRACCIRLYSEEDFEARPEFTEPEIQRTSLASVILQMTSLGLGDVTRFPFVDPPDERQVADGVRLLEELGAFATGERRPRAAPGPRSAAHGIRADPRPAAARPAAGADGHRGRAARLHARGARHRGGTVDPGPARAARSTRRPRPTSRTPGSRTSAPTSPACTPCGATSRTSRRRCRTAPSAACARTSTSTTCASASGRTCTPSCAPPAGRCASTPTSRPRRATPSPTGTPSTRRCSPACCRTSVSATRSSGSTPGRAAPGSASAPGRRCSASSRTSSWPPSSSRRAGCGRGSTRAIEPEWAEEAGRPRRRPHRQRAALEPEGGRRRRDRAGHPLRRAARHRPHDPVRPGRPRGGARDLHPVGPRRGRLGAAARVLEAERRHPGAGRRARGAGPSARHRRRRRGALRLLRRPDPARRAHRAALRPLVARGAAPAARPAHPHRGDPHLRGRGGGVGRRLPAHLAPG